MAINEEFEGSRRSLPVTYPTTPTPGVMCRVGLIPGIALTAKDGNGNTVVEFSSETYWNLSVTCDSGAIAVGDPLYFHDAGGINNTASGGLFCGNALDVITSGTATIRVVLPGAGSAYANATMQTQVLAVAATTTYFVAKMPVKGIVTGVSIVSDTGQAASDTINWTATIVNKGAAGSGSAQVATRICNVAGGAIVALVEWPLVLSGTPANLAVNAGDILVITMTKLSTATTLATLLIALKVQ